MLQDKNYDFNVFFISFELYNLKYCMTYEKMR